ncbi:MAG: lipoprotein [Steroidobacteraceae bacterium]
MAWTRFIPLLVPAALLALAGCGQTGALYLPDEGVETPVEVRTTQTPAPESAPAPAPAPAPKPEDKDKDQPKGP